MDDALSDEQLLEQFHLACDRDDRKLAERLSRMLAERDPDRDPAYVARLVGDRAASAGRSAQHPDGFLGWLVGDVPLGAEEWGFPRLRRLEPVRYYTARLGEGSVLARAFAVFGLGDTADPAAIEPLLTAFADPNHSVRVAAVQAVWRLARAGVDTTPAQPTLVEALDDPHRKVKLEAARALCVLGFTEVVADARDRVPWWRSGLRRDLDACLRGEIPPLPKAWAGDT